MDPDIERKHLAVAEHHIHEVIVRIRQQQARLGADRPPEFVVQAQRLLDNLYESLRLGLAHRRIIVRTLYGRGVS